MSEVLISPGVFLQENDLSQITQGPITVGAALVGPTVTGPVNVPTVVTSYSQYKSIFGAAFVSGGANYEYLTSMAALNYFEQGGDSLIVTRVASGSYTTATASVYSNNGATGSVLVSSSFDVSSSFTLSGSTNGQFFIQNNLADAAPIYYISSSGTAAGVVNNIVTKINALSSTFGVTVAAINSTSMSFSSVGIGAYTNAYSYQSGSFTQTFSGGVDPVEAFKLETISYGTVMNNAGGTVSNGSLPSGSLSNVRWEVANSDSGSGLFSLIVRRGDDYENNKTVLETWTNLSLDPNQPNYISYVIGDQVQNAILDEDGNYFLQVTGSYRNQSRYVRVKSINVTTPGYFDNSGNPRSEYTASLPLKGSGSVNGAFGGASGPLFGCFGVSPLNMFEAIPTVSSDTQANNKQGVLSSNYNIAISLLSNKDAYRFNVVYAPGINAQNSPSQVNSLVNLAQERGDNIAVVDMVGYAQTISTVVSQANAYDNSYAATYWPWVQIRSRETGKVNFVPASTMIPAIYEYNDKVSAEWFAPAGLNRGGMSTVLQPERRLSVANRNTLYAGKVNPIAVFPGVGTVIYGQKTLQAKASALDRVNVRRLLIALKDYIGQIGETLVFEPNTQVTRNRFLNQVNPYLEYVQQRQGLYAFQVIMDETNNTPDVIDRNQLVGTIYLQPTRAAEYIYLNFNILPTGATFS